jgi:hypothetical protein
MKAEMNKKTVALILSLANIENIVTSVTEYFASSQLKQS